MITIIVVLLAVGILAAVAMTPDGLRAPVVVAVDGAGTAHDAVEWASAEAAARRCPLRIVHAFHPRRTADGVVEAAVARARSVASEVEVSAQPMRATPTRAVLEASEGASLLVLGSRAPSGLRRLLTRSVSIQATGHARCPVVIVRPSPPAGDPGWTSPRVVVGIDDTPSGPAALGFALRAARQRGVPLIAVRAWIPDRPADLEGVCGPTTLAEALARRTLERVLAHEVSEFPEVSVHALLVRAEPEQALLAHSRGAALLVVGTRGRGQLRGTVLGSVSQAVLRQGHCPLAVIGQEATTATSRRRHAADDAGGPGWRGTPGDRRRPA